MLVGKFLRELHGKVEFPISTDDLTKLIERHVDDLDLYADLSAAYGEGVEGVTEFRPGHKPSVRISVDLSNSDNRENRLRTTLTHEFGHVHFHTWLFDDRQEGLFPRAVAPVAQVCKRETIIDAPMVDWMEWQAGHVCGAILMPASKVRRVAKDLLQTIKPPDLEPVTATGAYGAALIQQVMGRFQVSAEAARVRLFRLSILNNPV